MARAERVTTLALLPPDTASLVVPEAEAAAYRRHNPTADVIGHPDDLIGLPLKRQWIMDQFGTHVSFDDDLTEFVDATQHKSRKMGPDEVHGRFQRLTDEVLDLDGCFLGGTNPEHNPIRYNEGSPYALSGFVCFFAFVWTEGSRLWLHADSYGQDDFWMSALNAYYHRMALIDLRVIVNQPAMLKNPGGLATFRSEKHERVAQTLLRKSFGDQVVVPPSRNDSMRSTYASKYRLPF